MKQHPLGHQEPEPDPFLESVNRAIEFAKDRAIPLIFTGIVLLLGILAAVWYMSYRVDRRVDAFVQIYDALSAFESASQATSEDRSAELENVIAELEKVDAESYRPRARFFQARAALEKGDAAKAAQLFREIAKVENGIFGLFAQLGYGAALEQQEDWEGAMKAYAESAIEPFREVPGYTAAWVEAAFGRARVARRLGRPDEAKAAYEAIVERYIRERDDGIERYGKMLAERARSFLEQHDAPSSASDLEGLLADLSAWIQATLQKPEAQRGGLNRAIQIQSDIESYFKALVDAKRAEKEGRADSALISYEVALGDVTVVPTRTQYQRALLELERLNQMLR